MTEPIVKIKLGQLRGSILQDANGKDFFSFKGIPYAKPPVGELRFKAPQPIEPWTGIKDATQEGDQCYHRHLIYKELVGSEDCLFLNVYTTALQIAGEPLKAKPVMVFIHGGAFVGGSGDSEIYGPEFLITQDIVLVTINYRLGLLGFLSLDDPSLGVPGNAGMKDQVLALKWVQEHIGAFGGDPNNVTIFGESAGGASVHLLMLSPMAKGLFHKAIAQSGCAINDWSVGKCYNDLLAKILNVSVNDDKAILNYLRNAPVEKVLEAQEKLPDKFNVSVQRAHGPVIEKKVANEEAFLTEQPVDILSSGNYQKVPFMSGYTSREGMLVVISENRAKTLHKSLQSFDFETMVPFKLNHKPGSANSKKIADAIRKFYFGNEQLSEKTIDNFYMMQTDVLFLHGIYNSVKNHALNSSSPVYLYRFSVDGELNFYKTFGDIKTPGACHADELGYLFKASITSDVADGTVEAKSIKRMVMLWANFAKYGDPNPPKKDALINVKWEAVSSKSMNFLDIDSDLRIGVDPEARRMAFWDEITKSNSVSKL